VADEGKPIRIDVAVSLCWLPVALTPGMEVEAPFADGAPGLAPRFARHHASMIWKSG
jgi:hypothetical protein